MTTPHANILIHQSSYYRRDTFAAGLKAHGYQIINNRNVMPTSDDVLLVWNRSPSINGIAKLYAKAKAKIIVAENGYIGCADGSKTIALARTHHNGAGQWHVGEEDRWSQLGQVIRPWRKDGEHILLLPQRGIGEPGIASPRNWEQSAIRRLRRITDRPIKVRRHPGKTRCRPIEQDLDEAWCAVTWGSGAGIKTIVYGVPVFHDLRHWIGRDAASCVWDIEKPYLLDRMQMLHRLAWAQWRWDEIQSGLAFDYLLNGEMNNDRVD